MRNFRRRRNELKQETERPLNEQGRIDSALALMVTRIGHSMATERINQWHSDLKGYSIESIEWAFDSWSRNAKKLPAYSDILELLATWKTIENPGQSCPSECQQAHGTGYDFNDCLWLFKRVAALGRKATPQEWQKFFGQLNASRSGGTPKEYRGLPANWMVQ